MEVTVTDTGDGMTPDVQNQAFEPFFTTKDVGEGSGLGLSMVYGFARQSGGDAAIDSEPGKGTTIRILLPCVGSRAAKAAAKAEKRKTKAPGSETVLIVADDSKVRHLAAKTLGTLGYTVLEATDGPSAIGILEETPNVDLLFSEMAIPGDMCGRELAHKAGLLHKDLKVLLTSENPAEHLSKTEKLKSTLKLINKPYSKDELAATVRDVLDG